MKIFGDSKEVISKAAELSIRNWVDTVEDLLNADIENPVTAIEGLLKDIKIDSVVLQHKLKGLWCEDD